MHLRARAFQDDRLPGPPSGEAFLRITTNVAAFSSSLPVMILDTFGRDVPVSVRNTSVHVSMFEPVSGRTSLTNAPVFSTRAGFHMRGSSSMGMPQASFAIEFLDEFNDSRKLSPAGLPADAEWVLYAPNEFDRVLIHNPFVHQISREMGRYSARTRFVEVFLVRSNGPVKDSHYNGVYVLEERIRIGKNRVNIDHIGAEDLKVPEVTGGYILKFDRTGPGENGFSAGGVPMVFVEPKEATLNLPQRAPQKKYVIDYFNEFARVLNGPDWKHPTRGYRAYFDVDAAIDFHVLEVLSGNVDAMVLSTYLHKPREGKITFGPHWDFDRALGSTDGRDSNPRVWNTGPFFSGYWWPRLCSDPEFWQQWVDRWQELRTKHFALTNLNRVIDGLTGELREAQAREQKRWNLTPRGGTYQAEIDHMKNWLSNRIDYIDRQLVQPPAISVRSGSVARGTPLSFSAPTNSIIYFTLDGSDPRLPQGGLATNAFLYSQPITLTNNASVFARARDLKKRQTDGPTASTPWSSPITAKLEVAPR
jgi:hypothetical protein